MTKSIEKILSERERDKHIPSTDRGVISEWKSVGLEFTIPMTYHT